jgi:hypothetical protein
MDAPVDLFDRLDVKVLDGLVAVLVEIMAVLVEVMAVLGDDVTMTTQAFFLGHVRRRAFSALGHTRPRSNGSAC